MTTAALNKIHPASTGLGTFQSAEGWPGQDLRLDRKPDAGGGDPKKTAALTKIRQILGITFFDGSAGGAVERMRGGGLLVVPAAPALKDISTNAAYREALLEADLIIADSGFMVLIWNLISRDRIRRLSGLEYLCELLREPDVQLTGNTLWIMANPMSAERNVVWLQGQGHQVRPEDVYIAPVYGNSISDEKLLEKLRTRRYRHIVVTVGGGTQERLGLYIRRSLDYRPAIHCIGAAIAFLSGDQVKIPMWANRLYMGWLFRCISQPRRYLPRYWDARKLLPLMLRYRGELPPLHGKDHLPGVQANRLARPATGEVHLGEHPGVPRLHVDIHDDRGVDLGPQRREAGGPIGFAVGPGLMPSEPRGLAEGAAS
jgi:UDP-N-acetyl-D-mannosaminuronic acid transferase (WecB/TagA/CpsF family)